MRYAGNFGLVKYGKVLVGCVLSMWRKGIEKDRREIYSRINAKNLNHAIQFNTPSDSPQFTDVIHGYSLFV